MCHDKVIVICNYHQLEKRSFSKPALNVPVSRVGVESVNSSSSYKKTETNSYMMQWSFCL